MAARKLITKGQLEAALRESAGVYALAAQKLGVTRQTVFKRVNRSPKLLALCVELEETVGDLTMSVLIEGIRGKDLPTARWYADRKMKNRGFGQSSQRITIEGGGRDTPGAVMVEIREGDRDL